MMLRPALPALTGVRFIAALGVVIYHVQLGHLTVFPAPLGKLAALGRDGVDLFFVLSGFVLAYNYADWFARGLERRGEFLWIRAARIYPLALVALGLMVPLTLLFDPRIGHLSPTALQFTFALNALLIQTWIPLPAVMTSSDLWLGPSWSISVEVFCYVFFPPLAYGLLRHVRTPKGVALGVLGCYLAGLVLLIEGQQISETAVYFTPLIRIWEFAAGAILASTKLPRIQRADYLLIGAGLAVVAMAYRPHVGLLADQEWYVLAFPLAVAVVYLLASSPSTVGAALGQPTLVLLGEASYSLYLLHWPALRALGVLGVGHALPLTADIAILGALTLASLASYRWLEVPARRWLRAHRPLHRQGVAVGAGVGVNG